MQNSLLYLAFGEAYINECKYSILKLLEFYNLRPPLMQVHIITDKPQEFESLAPFFHQFEIRPLTEATLQQWRGVPPNNYRVKALAIRDFLEVHSGNVVFCDTDTIILRPLEPLFAHVAGGAVYMHQYEGKIAADTSFRKLYKRLTEKTSTAAEVPAFTSADSWHMWNSGIVALNHSQKNLLTDVVKLTDYIYSKANNHTSEQLAISFCLSRGGHIEEAAPYFYHYWNLKEFRRLLQKFFIANTEESVPNLIKKLHALDVITMQEEKNAYKRLPVLQKLVRNLTGKGWKIARYEKRL